VTWRSKLQPSVALNTMEAECFGLSEATSESVWLQRMLTELIGSTAVPPVIKCDNTAAIAIAHNPTQHCRSKHIDVRVHFVRERVRAGELKLVYVPSKDNAADVLTKGLKRVAHEHCVRLLGME